MTPDRLCIQEAKKAARYAAENGNDGSKPHTPAPLEADCLEIFETGRTLLATLGYPVFEPVAKPSTASSDQELFYCKRAGTNAVGEYTAEGFVVLKGSKGRAQVASSFVGHTFGKHRDALMQQGKLVVEDGVLLFKEDVLFSSPSGASAVVCGAASNGWTEWKNAKGATLEELKRGNTASSTND
ncbi:hypothetical protein OKW31_002718 [Paraburkholderia atlantica]|uniref:DUF4357 domain-containing protein n=1 Tax=Paraburkholderia atlantica TaxID=2654982 RepID=UPI003D22A143